MEDYIISKLVQKIIAPVVLVLMLCSLAYGWFIGDYPTAFKTIYMEPMQYVVRLVITSRLDRLERAQERISSTTNSNFK